MFIYRILIFVTFLVSQIVFANDSLVQGDMHASNDYDHKPTNLEEAKLLTVAVSDVDYPPFNFEENGVFYGFAIDILRHIEKHSKYRFRFVKLPWPRVLKEVKSGKFDLIPTFFKTQIRDKQYAFVEPNYGFEVNQFFSLVDNNITYNGDFSELSQYTIGVVRDYSYGHRFDNTIILKRKAELDEKALIRLLLGDRIKVIIGNPMTFYDLLVQHNMKNRVEALSPIVERTPVHFALTKNRADHKEIQKTFKVILERFIQSTEYQKLLDKYEFLTEYKM